MNLNIEEKELANLHDIMEKYIHLRYANVSTNKIAELESFAKLPSLLVLNASKNEINSLSTLLTQAPSL